MAKKGGLSADFLDRNLPGRKKLDPKLKEELEADEGPALETAAPEKPEAPAPEMPAAAPEKPAEAPAAAAPAAAPEKPAETPAAPAAPAAAKPDAGSVPVHVYTDLRAETKTLKEQLAKLQNDLEEAKKPKVEPKKEPEDLEPDPKTHPIEHEAWLVRDTRRQIAQVTKQLEDMGKTQTERTQQEQAYAARTEFETGITKLTNSHRTGKNPEGRPFEHIPDIDDRIAFLKGELIGEYMDSGYTAEQAETLSENAKMSFFLDCVSRGVDPIASISKFATRRGYQSKAAAPAAGAKPAGAGPTDAERIRKAKEIESAAKSAGSFPGAPPSASAADDDMTATKWSKMTIKEKKAYKKEHGDPVPKFMGAEEAVV